MMNSLYDYAPQTSGGTVDQVMRDAKRPRLPVPSALAMLGNPDMPTENIGEVGDPTPAQRAAAAPSPAVPAIPTLPPAQPPRQAVDGAMFDDASPLAQPPMQRPSTPLDGEVLPPGSPRLPALIPPVGRPTAVPPAETVQPVARPFRADDYAPPSTTADRDDVRTRSMMKEVGVAMLGSRSAAMGVRGMQMIFEANKPRQQTAEEIEAQKQFRALRAIEAMPGVDDATKHRAALALAMGDTKTALGILSMDDASRERSRKLQTIESAEGVDEAAKRRAKLAGELGENKAALKALGIGEPDISKGQEAVDRAYGKDFAAWKTGGAANAEKSLAQLRDVQTVLADPRTTLTGPIIGAIPDSLLAFTNTGEKAISTRELTQEIVQRSLREILGAQFTQKEGEALLARTYNPRLSEGENRKRLGRLVVQLQTAYADKQAAADYFEEHGTLTGFKGRASVTARELEDGLDEKPDVNAPASGGSTVQMKSTRPAGMDDAALRARAQQAIANGIPAARVNEQLRVWGVQP
jgi:hypothetical protein